MGKMSSYWRELRYICKGSADNGTRAALIAHSALFHLNNLAGRPRLTVPFSARIKISKDYQSKLLLRTFSGDLFVLFEVLEERVLLYSGSRSAPQRRGRDIGLWGEYRYHISLSSRSISLCADL